MVVKDKTYQMLYDYMLCDIKDSQIKQYKVMLDQWIATRNSIVEVFIETLAVRQEKFHLTNDEKSLIEIFRCLDPETKARYANEIQHTYMQECKIRSKDEQR